MTFEQYLRSAPEETRRNYMQHLRRFGEPDAVLRRIAGAWDSESGQKEVIAQRQQKDSNLYEKKVIA